MSKALFVSLLGPILLMAHWGGAKQELREELSRTCPLVADGRFRLKNIVGPVSITAWDRAEVSIRAIKRARTQAALNGVKIEIEATPGAVNVETKYDDERHRRDDGASVEYEIRVPRRAKLESVETVVGSLAIKGIAGSVKASSGTGGIEADFDGLNEGQGITLSTVTGPIRVVLPSDADVEVRADTVNGSVRNDFGLAVRRSGFIGQRMAGTLGRGKARLSLNSVTGSISVVRAVDGRRKGEAKDLSADARTDWSFDKKAISGQIQLQMEEAIRSMRSAIESAQLEAERAIEGAFESLASSDEVKGETLQTEREVRSFSISGMPEVNAETFDGSLEVRGWDRHEVLINATKRARNEAELRALKVSIETNGSSVSARGERSGSSNGSVSFEIFMPRRAKLRLSTGDGSVRVADIEGDIEARTGDGTVEVRNGQGALRISTGDGRVLVRNFSGAVTARTGDGSMIFEGRFEKLEARTGDGSITLALPQDQGAIIEAEAEKVFARDLSATEEHSRGNTHRWRIGKGGPVFRLRTGDGHVFLRRAGESVVYERR